MTQVNYFGALFSIPTNDITILPSLMNGSYEKLELNVLKKILKPGMTFVDVGANIGIYSVIAAKTVGKKGKVYSFEPEPTNCAILKKNVDENHCSNIKIINAAVGSRNAKMNLMLMKNSIGTHHLLERENEVGGNKIVVPVISLDNYFKNKHKKIDAIKIDVEGYEPYVFLGAKKMLKKANYVFFEYNKESVEKHFGVQKFMKLIDDFPYQYKLDEKTNTTADFKKKYYENTLNTNILISKKKLTLTTHTH